MQYHRWHPLSCGVLQIAGVNWGDTQQFVNCYMEACQDVRIHPGHDVLMFRHIIFSDNSRGRGKEIAKNLAKMGTVTKSPFMRNPNSYSNIAVWTWNPNIKTINKLEKLIEAGEEYRV